MTKIAKSTPTTIAEFKGKWSFLSNFDPSPIQTTMPNSSVRIEYPTAEHAFQANKSMSVKDRQRIASAPSASAAKKLGRSLTLRPDWDLVKYRVMEGVLALKFKQNPDLHDKLLDTGDAVLIEGNEWHDQIWGSCNCERHVYQQGQNALGILLMYHRLLLRADAEFEDVE